MPAPSRARNRRGNACWLEIGLFQKTTASAVDTFSKCRRPEGLLSTMTATLTAQLPGGASEKALLKILSNYRKPRTGRSLYELAVTLVPFVFLWAAASVSIHFGYWLGLLLVIPAAGFLLRLFILQHDCGHGSFSGAVAGMTGRVAQSVS